MTVTREEFFEPGQGGGNPSLPERKKKGNGLKPDKPQIQ